jgi:hypothetical protein
MGSKAYGKGLWGQILKYKKLIIQDLALLFKARIYVIGNRQSSGVALHDGEQGNQSDENRQMRKLIFQDLIII